MTFGASIVAVCSTNWAAASSKHTVWGEHVSVAFARIFFEVNQTVQPSLVRVLLLHFICLQNVPAYLRTFLRIEYFELHHSQNAERQFLKFQFYSQSLEFVCLKVGEPIFG